MLERDSDLAVRCQQGDVGAYAELVRRHRSGVRKVVYNILACREDVEDVAQEALVRGFEAIGQYRPRYEFRAWIRRIAVNCAVARLRERQRIKRLAERNAHNAEPGITAGPDVQAMARETQARVREALDHLPLRQRLALTLFALDDMDLRETAATMGCSVGAVKQHLHRGRRRLAELLAHETEED